MGNCCSCDALGLGFFQREEQTTPAPAFHNQKKGSRRSRPEAQAVYTTVRRARARPAPDSRQFASRLAVLRGCGRIPASYSAAARRGARDAAEEERRGGRRVALPGVRVAGCGLRAHAPCTKPGGSAACIRLLTPTAVFPAGRYRRRTSAP